MTSLYPHIDRLVIEARKRGIGVGVGSSGEPEKIWYNLRQAGLAELFEGKDSVVSTAECKRGKPFPDIWLEVGTMRLCVSWHTQIYIQL